MSSPPSPSAQSPSAPPADTALSPTAELDVDLDTALDGASDPKLDDALENAPLESREPTKKDVSLRDFISKMDEYAPIIPDAVTSHHLLLAGLDPTTTPLPLQRLLALATQKFIADLAADAYQYSRMRSTNTAAAATTAGVDPTAAPGGAEKKAGAAKDDKGKGHVLGVQRPGYGGGGAHAGQGGKAVLTMEDLGCAVGEYGVNVKRGEFYR